MMEESAETLWLDLHVAVQKQLFNSMDPAPFRKRDLDPVVSAYIVDWAEEAPLRARLGLRVTLTDEPANTADAALLRAAVHENFNRRVAGTRRELRRLFRDGRISLAIGLGFLAIAIVISEAVGGLIANEHYALLVQESVVIGGWVALWHPINIFLYDWWPIRASAKLYERLSRAEVQLSGTERAQP
jgi:hypothetical protein